MATKENPAKKEPATSLNKPENTTDDEKEVKRIRLDHSQCVLSSLMGSHRRSLVGNPRTKGGKNKYKHVILLDSSDPGEMVSAINKVDQAEGFFGMHSAAAGHLIPYLRLFMLDKTGSQTEIRFGLVDSIAANPGSQMSSFFVGQDARGGDAGIVEVNVEDLTSQPAEESNTMVCTIKIFFRTLNDLFNKETASGGKFSYADLITRVDPKREPDPLENRIKIIVGFSFPLGDTLERAGVPDGDVAMLRSAVQKSRRSLNLTLRDHIFTFNQDGTVELEITYNAALDGLFRDKRTELLISRNAAKQLGNIEGKESERREKEKKENERNPTVKDPPAFWEIGPLAREDPAEEAREKIDQLRRHAKENGFARMLEKLYGTGDNTYIKKIYIPFAAIGALSESENLKSSVIVNKQSCDEYNSLLASTAGVNKVGQPAKEGDLQTRKKMVKVLRQPSVTSNDDLDDQLGDYTIKAGPAPAEVTAAFKKSSGGELGDGKMLEILYFHYGDLVEIATEMVFENGRFLRAGAYQKKDFPPPIIGPMMLRKSFCDGKINRTGGNMADFPIALDTFVDWFTNSIIKTDRKYLLYRDFIGELNKRFVPAMLGETCRNHETGQAIHYAHLMPVTSQLGMLGKGGDIIDIKTARNQINKIEANAAFSTPNTQEYMLIYVPTYVPSLLTGNRLSDQGKGIYHLHLGRPDGIILNATFSANSQPHLAEAKTFGDGQIGTDISGGARYDINIDMLGNTFFRIGHLFYLDARALGLGDGSSMQTNAANLLGIGGYYQTNKINYKFTTSEFVTTLTGIFMGSGNDFQRQNAKEPFKPVPASAEQMKNLGLGNLVTMKGKFGAM